MKASEYNKMQYLCSSIYEAIDEYYQDFDSSDLPVEYQFAVNPDTFEVKVIQSLDETPEGWVYESVTDLEYDTIEDCAQNYFDLRR